MVNMEVYPFEFECKQFQTNIATNMAKVLIDVVDCDESELEDCLEKKWKNYPDKDFWWSEDVFKHYVRKQIEEYKNIPELSENGYQRVRIYRNGKKRQNLIEMVKTISQEYILTQKNPKKIDFFDVFGGTGIVTASMSDVIKGKRYYNEFDVIVANFFDCLNKFEYIGSDFTKYLAKLENSLRRQRVQTEQRCNKDLEILESFRISGKIRETATEDLIHKREKLQDAIGEIKILKDLLDDKKVEKYMIKYLAYYRKFTDKLEKTKKKEETTWKSIYHERFEAEFNNGARPKGHSECIDKMKTAAFYFYYINSFASRAISNSDITGVDPYGIAQLKKSISEYGVTWISEFHKRVKDVKVFSEDFAKILNETNKPNAIYYLDPPYFLTKQYDEGFPDKFHLKMLKWFRETDYKWILSCKSCPTNKLTWLKKRKGDYNVLIEYEDGAKGNYGKNRDWLNHDKDDISLREYFRLFLYEEMENRTKNKITFYRADTEKGKRNTRELFVYHGRNAVEEHFEIMISNIKVPDEHLYILENSGIIMEPFEEFFRPLLED